MELQVIRKVPSEALEHLKVLFDAAREHDHHEPLGEHKWLDLVHGGRPGFAGIVAEEAGHTHPVGYAHLSRHPMEAQWGLEVVVHPQHRGVGVELALVREALGVAAEEGGGHLHLWVSKPNEIHDGLAHRLGMVRGRDIVHMRATLPPRDRAELPPGVRLRAFEPGRDEDAWLEVNNRAFRHHPEQGAWDRPTLERRMAEPWFDAASFLLAEDDSGLVGFCWTKIDPAKSEGEIYVIATDPSRKGHGLGRAIVLSGLDHMAERGVSTATLYVDAENDGAVALYESLGFRPHHVDRAYVKDVAPFR